MMPIGKGEIRADNDLGKRSDFFQAAFELIQ